MCEDLRRDRGGARAGAALDQEQDQDGVRQGAKGTRHRHFSCQRQELLTHTESLNLSVCYFLRAKKVIIDWKKRNAFFFQVFLSRQWARKYTSGSLRYTLYFFS